jgi:hypothetical protein
MLDRSHRTKPMRRSTHYACVHLDLAQAIQHRPRTGIKRRVIFERRYDGFCRLKRTTATGQDVRSANDGLTDASAVSTTLINRNVPRSTMYYKCGAAGCRTGKEA